MSEISQPQSGIILYQTEDGRTRIAAGELPREATIRRFRIVRTDEVIKKFGIPESQQKAPNYCNLDVIISAGYRSRKRKKSDGDP